MKNKMTSGCCRFDCLSPKHVVIAEHKTVELGTVVVVRLVPVLMTF